MSEIEKNALQLVRQAENEAMETWSEDKRKEFVNLFHDRAEASRYILIKTAEVILRKAEQRHFISEHHTNKMDLKVNYKSFYVTVTRHNWTTSDMPSKIGGRDVEDLNRLAEDRATQILNELPPLKEAVRVIDKATAKDIDRRDQILAKLKELKPKLEAMAGAYDLSEVDQSMSIGEFRQAVKARDRKRAALSNLMDDLGTEGSQVDDRINKALYKGLPGLSDAVIKVVQDHLERAIAMDQTGRRVTEKVLYGDSEAAVSLLRGFEKDELKVSDNIKEEFSSALKKLGLAGKKKAKQLAAKKAK